MSCIEIQIDYQVIKLQDGKYAVVTSRGGLLVIKHLFKHDLDNEEMNDSEKKSREKLIDKINRES